ncbi:MAG: DUF1882 domain-containing protein [Lactobacillus sp.]|nr:DUF1882 domain-containing protein [Lactobacillus sp.]
MLKFYFCGGVYIILQNFIFWKGFHFFSKFERCFMSYTTAICTSHATKKITRCYFNNFSTTLM